MATYFLDPNSNNNALWSVNSYLFIDDAIREPNSVPTTDQISAIGTDDNENQAYNMETFTLPANYQVISVELWSWGYIFDGTVDSPYGDINWAGCNEKNLTFPIGLDNVAWNSVSWTGLTVTSQATIDGTIMSINSKGIDDAVKGPGVVSRCMYLKITTESTWTGPTDFTKWNGLNIQSQISKYNGIEWSNIKKWNGID